MGNYYQPEIETMPVEKLQALQSERLVEQVKYVYDHVEFYRNKMKEAGVEPEDIKGIEDLHKLPFVTKDLQVVQQAAVLLPFTHKKILMCGKTAVPVLSWQQAEQKMMYAM